MKFLSVSGICNLLQFIFIKLENYDILSLLDPIEAEEYRYAK